ncbi:MAG: CHAD domain-containing protein [Acidobacteriota bacterium]
MQSTYGPISISEIIIAGFKMIADERIANIESYPNVDKEELTHKVRITIKQFRALLRLIRPIISAEIYDQNNINLRDAGRRLSAIRDIVIARNLIKELLEEVSSIQNQDRLEVILKELARQASSQLSFDKSEVLANTIIVLKETRNYFTKLNLQKEGWDILLQGLKGTYDRARKIMKQANNSHNDKYSHNWRKVSKDLWYQLQYIELVKSNGLAVIIKRLKQLNKNLGRYHDYVVLIDRLRAHREIFGGNNIVDPVIEILNDRKERLRRVSFKVGKKIFSIKPNKFLSVILTDEMKRSKLGNFTENVR